MIIGVGGFRADPELRLPLVGALEVDLSIGSRPHDSKADVEVCRVYRFFGILGGVGNPSVVGGGSSIVGC